MLAKYLDISPVFHLCFTQLFLQRNDEIRKQTLRTDTIKMYIPD